MGVITQYDGSAGQETGLNNHLGSKEDVQEKFLEVGLVQNSYEVRYSQLKIYIQDSYVNGKDPFPKTLPDTLNALVNWKGGERPPEQQYEYSKGVDLTTKGNPGGFRGYCYGFKKSGHMDQDCPELKGEKGGKANQSGEDTHIKINLSE